MMAAAPSPLPLDGLQALRERHDVFLVDQFGVLHDGNDPYPGAVEALAALKASGATVVLVSNSGKRSRPNEDRLESLGFRPGSWDLFLSSGEVAWQLFSGQDETRRMPAGARCLLLARDGDRSAVAGLDLKLVEDGKDADVVLLAGSEGDRRALGCYRSLLAPAAERRVPLICTNPDKVMLTKTGHYFGAGTIADLYEELGGPVTRIGKPFPEIYEAALRAVGSPARERVVGIGDSVEHDIAGARGMGLAAALVRSGILAGMPPAELDALYAEHGATPDYVLPAFQWHPARG